MKKFNVSEKQIKILGGVGVALSLLATVINGYTEGKEQEAKIRKIVVDELSKHESN